MILVFGFRTPSATELPEILYLGDDGIEANRICAEDPHPRIARVTNPVLHSIKHWSEEASTVFEKEHGKKLGHPVTAPVKPELTGTNADDASSGKETSKNELDGLTLDELAKIADDEGIDVSRGNSEQDYREIIRLYRQLDRENSAAKIKALAQAEGVKTEGLKRQRDFVNAIVAHRRSQ
jgi:hypothetical protein